MGIENEGLLVRASRLGMQSQGAGSISEGSPGRDVAGVMTGGALERAGSRAEVFSSELGSADPKVGLGASGRTRAS